MADEQKSGLWQIEAELCALRAAIVANDVVAIECHTARAEELLEGLKIALAWERQELPELEAVRMAARNTVGLLVKARRTVRALMAVYQSFSVAQIEMPTELR